MNKTETIYLPDLGECKQGPNPKSSPRCVQNQRQRAKIRRMKREDGACFIVDVNGFRDKPDWKPLAQYRFGLPYNFTGCAIVPKYDERLAFLIRDRAASPYTGTADDGRRIDSIFNRIEEIGGDTLSWR